MSPLIFLFSVNRSSKIQHNCISTRATLVPVQQGLSTQKITIQTTTLIYILHIRSGKEKEKGFKESTSKGFKSNQKSRLTSNLVCPMLLRGFVVLSNLIVIRCNMVLFSSSNWFSHVVKLKQGSLKFSSV
jgi:hypothetical protein